ncbi:MAG: hypothetical protein Alpg2KO_07880 [Alphaproteobacteria bacterium]
MSDAAKADNVLLVVIIEKSFDLEVSEAFEQAGVKAFTRLEGTGSGVWQQLDRWVDPEKLIYLTVLERDQLATAFRYLKTTAQLEKPGVGIAFTLPVFEGIGVGIPLHHDD